MSEVERGAVTPEGILAQLQAIADESGSDGARVRALELLGKFHRMWSDAPEIPPGREYTPEQLREALLDRLAEKPDLLAAVKSRFGLVENRLH